MKTFLRRWCGALALVLCAFALPATAAPEATKISSSSIASFHNANGTVNNDAFGGGTGIGNFFDGNTSSGVYIGPNGRAANGCYVLLTFSESHFITAINASCTTTHKYSLYYSMDGEAWTAIEGGTEVSKAGTTELSPNVEASYIKCVFDQVGGWTPTFSELEVWGYVPPKPVKISSSSIASFHNANGTVNNDAFGGGTGIGNFFDGNTSSGVYIGPNGRAANGCYLLLTFDQAYYITTINASCATTHKYSLYYSTDGETWTGIADGTEVSKAGTTELTPNVTASYIKCVFDQVGGWTPTFSELEVWGMDPADIACTHPTYTEWAPVADTATCLENGIDERYCTVCNERFTRESTTLFPLGHDYVHTVTRAGTSSEFGAGSITCSRCDFCLDCSTPINVVTGTDTNGTKLCSMHVDGLHWFAELTVSSTGDEGWGQSPNKLIDKHWAEGEEWGAYWYGSQSGSGRDYVQFAFDETIDLAKVELSVPNRTHDVVFYAYDEANGTETEIQRLSVVADENNSNKLIRKTVYFFGEEASGYVLKALRVRSDNDGGNKFTLGEIHPYITARGAGMIRPVATIGNSGYASLAAAIEAVEEDAGSTTTIVLQKNVDLTGENANVTIPANKDVTLNLNGCTIAGNVDGDILVLGTLTLDDTLVGGKIYAVAPTGSRGLVRVEGGTFNMVGGAIESVPDPTDPGENGSYAVVYRANSTVNVSGGSITAGWFCLSGNGNDKTGKESAVTISGGTLLSTADYAVYFPNAGTLTISGNPRISGAAGALAARNGTVAISGGTFLSSGTGDIQPGADGTAGLGDVAVNIVGQYGPTEATISGGSFTAQENAVVLSAGANGATLAVSGGTFSQAVPDEYCAEGFAPKVVTEPVVDPESGEVTTPGVYGVKPVYTVTFVNEKGDAPVAQVIDVVEGNDVFATEPVPAPSAAGFDFTGWFADGSDTAFDFANTPIVADIELTAGWESSFVPPTPVQINIGAGLADYVPAEGETVPAPVAVENGAMKVSFVAPVDGTYMLCVATAVDGEYADDANTAEAHKAGDLVTLEYEIPAGDTAPARFFKIGFNQ